MARERKEAAVADIAAAVVVMLRTLLMLRLESRLMMSSQGLQTGAQAQQASQQQ